MNSAKHVHFIGIGGYGMSAIARVMLDMGYTISGSDVMSKELIDKLEVRGAKIYLGHDVDNLSGAELVVYSSDIPKNNIELLAAKDGNIPCIHRSEMLAKILNQKKSITVAGAHGKTTTSSMIAYVMEANNLDPTFIIGGEVLNIGSNAKAGTSDYVVAEVDESDGSFLKYYPYISVITNIEADHLENYDGNYENLKRAYQQYLKQVRPDGTSILCYDDEYIKEILSELNGNHIITYGCDDRADYVATDLKFAKRASSFTVINHGETLGKIELSVPGKHNVLNAMATIVVCLEIGMDLNDIARALLEFTGAKRRFQVIGEHKGITVIDDYSHHPTEIKATINAAKAAGKRIIAVFQPQRYSRTFFLLDAFSKSFSEADEVIITNIYSPAGDSMKEKVSAIKLVDLIKENSNDNVKYFPTKEEVFDYLSKSVKEDDLVLTMGAGDIWKVAYKLVDFIADSKSL